MIFGETLSFVSMDFLLSKPCPHRTLRQKPSSYPAAPATLAAPETSTNNQVVAPVLATSATANSARVVRGPSAAAALQKLMEGNARFALGVLGVGGVPFRLGFYEAWYMYTEITCRMCFFDT